MPSITVDAQVDIAAAVDTVWEVLTDFAHCEQWNPFMRIEGVAEAGTKLTVHMSANGEHGMTFRPTVLSAIPGRELRWLGKLGLHGIVDGEHYFILTPNEDGTTHLDHGERFSGILVALAKGSAGTNNNSGYDAFSQALKQRAESVSHCCQRRREQGGAATWCLPVGGLHLHRGSLLRTAAGKHLARILRLTESVRIYLPWNDAARAIIKRK